MGYPESLEVAGVSLRRWDAQRDLPLLRAMAVDEEIGRFIPMSRDEAALAAGSERLAAHWSDAGFGLWAARSPDGAGAGWVGACHVRWHPDFAQRVELAWSLTRSLRGRGIAVCGAAAAARACFSELGLDEVLAFVDPQNAPSLAVVERLGMAQAATARHPESGIVLNLFALRRPDA